MLSVKRPSVNGKTAVMNASTDYGPSAVNFENHILFKNLLFFFLTIQENVKVENLLLKILKIMISKGMSH